MIRAHEMRNPSKGEGAVRTRLVPPVPVFWLQPILAKVVRRIAAENPDMFNRLGPHRASTFVIDPVNMPFALALRPDPDNLMFRAVHRGREPEHVARIAGKFLDLLQLMDCDVDGDALFFSRGLEITGNTEAVVCLRNALDDVDGSIAESVADMFGPPGRAILRRLLAMAEKPRHDED